MPRYGKGYEHVDDAGAAALMALERQPRAAEQEFMGLLIRDPVTGLIYRTDFQTQGERHASSWRGVPDGKVVGIAHNHPAQRRGVDSHPATTFSQADIRTASSEGGLGVPSYIAGMGLSNGQRKYVPGSTPTQKTSMNDGGRTVAAGEQFLAQFPIEEFLQYISARTARENPIAAAIIAEHNRTQVASRGNPTRR